MIKVKRNKNGDASGEAARRDAIARHRHALATCRRPFARLARTSPGPDGRKHSLVHAVQTGQDSVRDRKPFGAPVKHLHKTKPAQITSWLFA